MINLMPGEIQCIRNALGRFMSHPYPVGPQAHKDYNYITPKVELDSNLVMRISSALSASLGKQPYDDDFILALRSRIKDHI